MSALLAAGVVLGLSVAPGATTAAGANEPELLLDVACPTERVPPSTFTDVAARSPHARAAACLAWWRIAAGRSATSFAPAAPVTRGQMASFVYRLLVSGGTRFAPRPDRAFTDADGTHRVAIDHLTAAGIVHGVSDTRFAPDRPITRAQAASLMRNADLHVTGDRLGDGRRRFDDVTGVHAAAVELLAGRGVLTGTGARTFSPDRLVTRDQMASMLARLQGSLMHRSHVMGRWHPRFHPVVEGRGMSGATAIAAADLDGDGRDELILVGEDEPAPPDRLAGLFVYRAVDDDVELTQFLPTPSIDGPYFALSLAVADIGGDGRPDVIVPGRDGTFEVFTNDGTGQLTPDGRIATAHRWPYLVAADVDGDGRDDLVSVDVATDAPIEIHRQGADGTFASPELLPRPPGGVITHLDAGDLDGDGRTDLVMFGPGSRFSVYLQRDGGRWERFEHDTDTQVPLTTSAIADPFGEGGPFLITLGGGELRFHRVSTDGRIDQVRTLHLGTTQGFAVGAVVDGPGRQIVASHGGVFSVITEPDPTPGDPPPRFVGRQHQLDTQGMVVTDLTGDGTADVAFATLQFGLMVAPSY